MKKKLLIFVIGAFFVLCAVAAAVPSQEWTLTVAAGEAQAEFSLNEIRNLPTLEAERHGFIYKGVLLRDFLTYAGVDTGKIEDVEIAASDGYKVRYEGKLARSNKVILAYEKDGSFLSEEKEGRIRAIVVGGRSAMQIKFVKKIFVKMGSWRLLLISGEKEMECNLSDLQRMPSRKLSLGPGTYRGVSLRTFLEETGINIKGIKTVRVVAADSYAVNYERETILEERVILAYEMNGAPLPAEMGTVRCVFSGKDKKMQVKRVERIIVE